VTDEPITEAKIKELLADGTLPNLFRWWHYKQVTACAMAVEDTLTKLEKQGFSLFEIYYALRQHFFFTRFALEDAGQEKGAAQIDKEMNEDLYQHRKKFTVEAMRTGKYGHPTKPQGSSEPIQP
jgi:hypothetical protein